MKGGNPPTTYKCARCGGPVEMAKGVVLRPCKHDDAGIIADMFATARGVGSMAQ